MWCHKLILTLLMSSQWQANLLWVTCLQVIYHFYSKHYCLMIVNEWCSPSFKPTTPHLDAKVAACTHVFWKIANCFTQCVFSCKIVKHCVHHNRKTVGTEFASCDAVSSFTNAAMTVLGSSAQNRNIFHCSSFIAHVWQELKTTQKNFQKKSVFFLWEENAHPARWKAFSVKTEELSKQCICIVSQNFLPYLLTQRQAVTVFLTENQTVCSWSPTAILQRDPLPHWTHRKNTIKVQKFLCWQRREEQ